MSNLVKPYPSDTKYRNMSYSEFEMNYQRDLAQYEQARSLEKIANSLNQNNVSNIETTSYSEITNGPKQKSMDDYLTEIDDVMEADEELYNSQQKEKKNKNQYTQTQVEYARLCLNEDRISRKLDFWKDTYVPIIVLIISVLIIYSLILLGEENGMVKLLLCIATIIGTHIFRNLRIAALNNQHLKIVEQKANLRNKK